MSKKQKAMTKKEFVAVLEKAGMYFDVYGYEGILNMIALYSKYASDLYELKSPAISKMYQHQDDVIYEELSSRGYYDV